MILGNIIVPQVFFELNFHNLRMKNIRVVSGECSWKCVSEINFLPIFCASYIILEGQGPSKVRFWRVWRAPGYHILQIASFRLLEFYIIKHIWCLYASCLVTQGWVARKKRTEFYTFNIEDMITSDFFSSFWVIICTCQHPVLSSIQLQKDSGAQLSCSQCSV